MSISPEHSVQMETDQRMNNLEMKFAFLEEHILQQDKEMLKLRQQVERLTEQAVELAKAAEPSRSRELRDDIPPHY